MDSNQQLRAIKEKLEPAKSHIMDTVNHHNSKVQNLGWMPTNSQTEKCAQHLLREFPTLRVDLIVKALHHMVHPECSQSQE